jgi:predicted lipoprotein with Yx(FWY)xxD motif
MKHSLQYIRFFLVIAIAACSASDNKATVDAPEAAAPDISLSTAGSLGSHLVDSQGKTLYFFVNDLAGSDASTYSGTAWPTFDVETPTVGSDLTATDFSRFERADGAFQTTWKGRPLYYYASDTTAAPTAGEGIGGRWFVARDYTLFFGADAGVTLRSYSLMLPALLRAQTGWGARSKSRLKYAMRSHMRD